MTIQQIANVAATLDGNTSWGADMRGAMTTLYDTARGVTPVGNGGALVTAASYTFVLGDLGAVTYGDSASAQTFTVPPNSSVAYPVGATVGVGQVGVGGVTVAAGAGVTIEAVSGDLAVGGQGAVRTLHQRVLDVWVLI